MYTVSNEFLERLQGSDETFKIEIRIQHSQGKTVLYDEDISQNSFTFEEASQVGDEFTVGGVFASNIEFDIVNREKFDDIKFIGAKVYPVVYLLIKEGVDAHFLQSTQPSDVLKFEDEWEAVPLGEFNIDVANRHRSTIEIKAIDNMIFLDRPYSLSKLVYPANLGQIYNNICTVGDVLSKTVTFPNMDYMVHDKPTGDITLRNILGFVAELTGSFARFDRGGKLELVWYEDVGVTIGPNTRSKLEFDDEDIQITGIFVESDVKDSNDENIIHLIGTDEYAIDLTGNPLLSGGYQELFNTILSRIGGIKFRPYLAEFYGNPALQAGDIITQLDVDGVEHRTIITHSEFKFRGTGKLEARAKSNIVRGFKSTDNRVAKIVQDLEREIGDELTDLEQAIINATNLLTNSLGGHVLKRKGELLIMDNEDPDKANKVWRWNLSGLGYTENFNADVPRYETAMTMDGRINANFITTGQLSANLIESGILQSQNGSTSLNLNTGNFNVAGNSSIYIGNVDSGTYTHMRPGDPLQDYYNGVRYLDLWSTPDSGGSLSLYNNLGNISFAVGARKVVEGRTDIGGANIGCDNLVIGMSTLYRPNIYRSTQFHMDGHFHEHLRVNKNLQVSGDKNAIVRTEHFGDRLLYSEESDRVYFNTKGIEETKNNKFIIRLDDAFLETIEPNSKCPYIINLTPYANARVWIKDVFDRYIIVESDVDCKFAYNVQCIRKGREDTYLTEVDLRSERGHNDYEL